MAIQFKIQLKNTTDQTVWRRVMVPEQFSFLKFHEVIQAAFSKEENHFVPSFRQRVMQGYPIIGIPPPETGKNG